MFTGDTLFQGGPGATGRSFSSFDTIIDSIRTRLLTLPATTVRTGHGDPTSIGAERRTWRSGSSAGTDAASSTRCYSAVRGGEDRHRELRQHASRYVAMAKAGIASGDDRQVVAYLVPADNRPVIDDAAGTDGASHYRRRCPPDPVETAEMRDEDGMIYSTRPRSRRRASRVVRDRRTDRQRCCVEPASGSRSERLRCARVTVTEASATAPDRCSLRLPSPRCRETSLSEPLPARCATLHGIDLVPRRRLPRRPLPRRRPAVLLRPPRRAQPPADLRRLLARRRGRA